MKGTRIPKNPGSLRMLGESLDNFIMDGHHVWSTIRRGITFKTDGIFAVPPGITAVKLCGVAGGGGGSTLILNGGSAGAIVSGQEFTVTPLEEIVITIGIGGAVDATGTDTKFGSQLTLQGGAHADYQGVGGSRTSCGGVRYDGQLINTYYGGQASPFADGGDGEDGEGLLGAGGGAGLVGGKGGDGQLIITWVEEE